MSNPPARVAIVEDEHAPRGAIAGALERAGYTVGAWADGTGSSPVHDPQAFPCPIEPLNLQG